MNVLLAAINRLRARLATVARLLEQGDRDGALAELTDAHEDFEKNVKDAA